MQFDFLSRFHEGVAEATRHRGQSKAQEQSAVQQDFPPSKPILLNSILISSRVQHPVRCAFDLGVICTPYMYRLTLPPVTPKYPVLLYVSCALAGIRIESDRLICQQMGESLTIGFGFTFSAEY